jgi:hypothetical protein
MSREWLNQAILDTSHKITFCDTEDSLLASVYEFRCWHEAAVPKCLLTVRYSR